jgi:hypothetical protein
MSGSDPRSFGGEQKRVIPGWEPAGHCGLGHGDGVERVLHIPSDRAVPERTSETTALSTGVYGKLL